MGNMVLKNYKEIELGGELFEAIRNDFDLMFQKLFKRMQDNNSDEGTIDLKISVIIHEEEMPDPDGVMVPVKMPIIKHKISTQVPVKEAMNGAKDVGMALVYDPQLMRYVMKFVSLDGQTSIFDEEEDAGYGLVESKEA